MSEARAETRRGALGWVRRLDDAVFAIEQAVVAVALLIITVVIFIDVVARRANAPDSKVGQLIARIAGAGVTIIDPAPAVARQLGRVLETRTLANDGRGCPRHRFLSSGEPAHLETAIEQLLGLHFPAQALPWTSELRLSTS